VARPQIARASVLIESEPKLQVIENALGNQRRDADRTDDSDRSKAERQELSRMIPGHRGVHLLPSTFRIAAPAVAPDILKLTAGGYSYNYRRDAPA
jgi:hypothetical protein